MIATVVRRALRPLIATTGVAAALLVVRLWWGAEAQRRMQAEVDALRSRGEPMLAVDFAEPPGDGPDGAAVLAELADSDWYLEDIRPPEKLPDDPLELSVCLTDIERRFARGIEILRKLRGCERADWNRSPQIGRFGYEGARLVQTAIFLSAWTAVARHLLGDDATAFERLRDVVHAHRIFDGAEPGFHWTWHVVIKLSNRPAVSGGSAPSGVNAVPRATVEALVRELLDERPLRAVLLREIRLARARLAVGPTTSAGRETLIGGLDWWTAPYFELYRLKLVRACEPLPALAHAPDWPSFQAGFKPLPASLGWTPAADTRDALSRDVEGVFREMARARAAATLLAIALFEIDHGGRPSRLDELVPVYLPAVPVNPMHSGARPFEYSPRQPVPIMDFDLDRGL